MEARAAVIVVPIEVDASATRTIGQTEWALSTNPIVADLLCGADVAARPTVVGIPIEVEA